MTLRRFLITVFVGAVALAAAAQQRQAPAAGGGGQFQISGIVVNAINDQPLANAYVTITAVQGGAARTVTTGAGGAFRLDGVRAGKYQLSAERRGFASQQYQQSRKPLHRDCGRPWSGFRQHRVPRDTRCVVFRAHRRRAGRCGAQCARASCSSAKD